MCPYRRGSDFVTDKTLSIETGVSHPDPRDHFRRETREPDPLVRGRTDSRMVQPLQPAAGGDVLQEVLPFHGVLPPVHLSTVRSDFVCFRLRLFTLRKARGLLLSWTVIDCESVY